MELISKFNKGIHFLLCVIAIFSKYPWLIPMKYKKRISIINVYIDKLDYTVNKYNNTNHRIIKRKSVKSENITTRFAHKNLVSKGDIANFV